MGIFELLSSKEDIRKGGSDCSFNGYLEDYIETIEDGTLKDIFASMLSVSDDLKIVTGLWASISKESISNAVIRYKDITKLDSKAVCVPYIVYGKKDGNEKAVILTEEDYIYAKGLYYALTEAGAAMEIGKNDCVATSLSDGEETAKVTGRLFQDRAGQIQRELDRKHFASYDIALARAQELCALVKPGIEEAVANGADKEQTINAAVSKWFLLKKFVYVQYMIDKRILKEVHQDNIKQQRNRAKENADSIRFVSISELWKGSSTVNNSAE